MKKEIKEKRIIMCHCCKCGKYSVGMCVPCALRMRDKAVEKEKQKWLKEKYPKYKWENGKITKL